MNIILLILIIIYIFLLGNYFYRKKGMPYKSLKEIWSEFKFEWSKYKQESKEDWIKHKQKINEEHKQKINEKFKKKKEQKDLKKIENSYKEIYEEYKNLSIDEQSKFLYNLSLNNQDNYAEAIRDIHIMEESIDIALKSKNKDIAESRKNLHWKWDKKYKKNIPKLMV